jgi:hypothetical protein
MAYVGFSEEADLENLGTKVSVWWLVTGGEWEVPSRSGRSNRTSNIQKEITNGRKSAMNVGVVRADAILLYPERIR